MSLSYKALMRKFYSCTYGARRLDGLRPYGLAAVQLAVPDLDLVSLQLWLVLVCLTKTILRRDRVTLAEGALQPRTRVGGRVHFWEVHVPREGLHFRGRAI